MSNSQVYDSVRIDKLEELVTLVQDMKRYLGLGKIHTNWLQQEILAKYKVSTFQDMAYLAYEKADSLNEL